MHTIRQPGDGGLVLDNRFGFCPGRCNRIGKTLHARFHRVDARHIFCGTQDNIDEFAAFPTFSVAIN